MCLFFKKMSGDQLYERKIYRFFKGIHDYLLKETNGYHYKGYFRQCTSPMITEIIRYIDVYCHNPYSIESIQQLITFFITIERGFRQDDLIITTPQNLEYIVVFQEIGRVFQILLNEVKLGIEFNASKSYFHNIERLIEFVIDYGKSHENKFIEDLGYDIFHELYNRQEFKT